MRCAYPSYQEPGATRVLLCDEDKNHPTGRPSLRAISRISLRAAVCMAASHDWNDGMCVGSKANERRI